MPAVGGGDLRDRLREHLQMIRGGVRASVTRTKLDREEFTGVVAGDQDRMKPIRVLVGRRRAFLVAMRQHDRGVHVEHDHPFADVPACRPC
jgi:hypothetical protein